MRFARVVWVVALLAYLGCRQPTPETRLTLSTPEAQAAFDRGLVLHYGFYADQALAAFERAASLDPQNPLPRWGIALALGPRTNDPGMDARMPRAFKEATAALTLAERTGGLPAELAGALVTRYVDSPTFDAAALNRAYASAMERVLARYPVHADVATLFAEAQALVAEQPWWSREGAPNADIARGTTALEKVLERDPLHVGANHYYIHFIEGTAAPERAEPSARRLESLVPDVGHLLHMPSHIYMRTGDYAAAVSVNQRAMAADGSGSGGHMHEGVEQMLAGHTREYLAAAASMTGQSAVALAADPYLFPRLRFGRWDDVLARPKDEGGVGELEWHVAQAIALTAKGRLGEARRARDAALTHAMTLPVDAKWWGDPLARFLPMVEHEMNARLAWAAGQRDESIAQWRHAVEAQDALTRSEAVLPWFHPLRESLGAALFESGDYAVAEEVFRDDLRVNPGNPRSLFGLSRTLTAMGRTAEAGPVAARFREAWRHADVTLAIADLR